jgi:hypothetical protein
MPPAVPFAIPIGELDAGGGERLLGRGGGEHEGGGWRARNREHRRRCDRGDGAAGQNAQSHDFLQVSRLKAPIVLSPPELGVNAGSRFVVPIVTSFLG